MASLQLQAIFTIISSILMQLAKGSNEIASNVPTLLHVPSDGLEKLLYKYIESIDIYPAVGSPCGYRQSGCNRNNGYFCHPQAFLECQRCEGYCGKAHSLIPSEECLQNCPAFLFKENFREGFGDFIRQNVTSLSINTDLSPIVAPQANTQDEKADNSDTQQKIYILLIVIAVLVILLLCLYVFELCLRLKDRRQRKHGKGPAHHELEDQEMQEFNRPSCPTCSHYHNTSHNIIAMNGNGPEPAVVREISASTESEAQTPSTTDDERRGLLERDQGQPSRSQSMDPNRAYRGTDGHLPTESNLQLAAQNAQTPRSQSSLQLRGADGQRPTASHLQLASQTASTPRSPSSPQLRGADGQRPTASNPQLANGRHRASNSPSRSSGQATPAESAYNTQSMDNLELASTEGLDQRNGTPHGRFDTHGRTQNGDSFPVQVSMVSNRNQQPRA